MAVCRLQNVMNMYDVDLTAQGISFVYMVDQSQIAGTEAACWPCRDRALHKELARALALVYEWLEWNRKVFFIVLMWLKHDIYHSGIMHV